MKRILLLLVLFCYGTHYAQNIFQDDFASYFSGVNLDGQGAWTHNSSNIGGLGAATGAIPANIKVIATPVSYLNYGASTNSIEIHADADGCGTGFPAVTSGNLYVSFVLNLSNTLANNNSDFFRVMSGNNLITSFRLYATNAPNAFFLGVCKGANGNQINFTPNAYSYNPDHLIVVKYAQGAGTSDDAIAVYVDPVYANGEPAFATITNNVGLDQSGSLDRLSFRQNWTNGMPTGHAGLVSVARTWADLSFVPLSTTPFNASNTITISGQDAKNGVLNLKSSVTLDNATLQIIALNGVVVERKSVTIDPSVSSINIQPLQKFSVYIVAINDASGKHFTQKIMVQ